MVVAELANEFGLQVRLWVDDLGSFAKLCPEADAEMESQHRRGVEPMVHGGQQPAEFRAVRRGEDFMR